MRARTAAWRAVAAAAVVAGLVGSARAAEQANVDTFAVLRDSGPTRLDVLGNDDPGSPGSRLSVFATTPPSHGTLSIAPGGLAVTYTPTPGYVGPDSFTYTASNSLMTVDVPRQTLAVVTGTPIFDGYGSAVATVPGAPNDYYVMTDRGPNVDGPSGGKVFALTGFTPQIARFHLADGVLTQVGPSILLRDAAGNPRSGLPPPAGVGGTGEVPYDNFGNVLAADANGIDSEGLVALPDGTFWVSDEYGPFLVHFAANGDTIEQLSPFAPSVLGRRLPAVLGRRLFNKGMEGLTITPSGKQLVGIMQNSLVNGVSAADAGKSPIVRIVTFDLVTDATHTAGVTHQYLYMLDGNSFGVSEIAAVPGSETDFYVDERDGKFPGDPAGASTQKRVYRVSLVGATDVSVAGDPVDGFLVGAQTLEQLTNKATAAAAATSLSAGGVIAAGTGAGTNNSKTLTVDLLAQMSAVGGLGTIFPHDKVEGVVAIDGGRRLVISNDCDFGVVAGPSIFSVVTKKVPTLPGTPADFTQLLFVDLQNLPSVPVTASVTIDVQGPRSAVEALISDLRAAADDAGCCHRHGGRKLDDAADKLNRALVKDAFADETHLSKKGEKLFEALEAVVRSSDRLIDRRGDCIDDDMLQGFIDRSLWAARKLVEIALMEAPGQDVSSKAISRGAEGLALGDVAVSFDDWELALDFYERAWKDLRK